MEALMTFNNMVIAIIAIYSTITIYHFIKSYNFRKSGIRTKAKIISIQLVEESDASNESQSLSRYANIEYTTEDHEVQRARVSIAKRHQQEQYKNNFPIIYQKGKSNKPIIDETLYIYQTPVNLISLFLVMLIVFAIMMSEFS